MKSGVRELEKASTNSFIFKELVTQFKEKLYTDFHVVGIPRQIVNEITE